MIDGAARLKDPPQFNLALRFVSGGISDPRNKRFRLKDARMKQ